MDAYNLTGEHLQMRNGDEEWADVLAHAHTRQFQGNAIRENNIDAIDLSRSAERLKAPPFQRQRRVQVAEA